MRVLQHRHRVRVWVLQHRPRVRCYNINTG